MLGYLAHLYESGSSYSSVNIARSTLSLLLPKIDSVKVGEHWLVCRLMKGISKQRPPAPKYSHTWDVDQVLLAIKKMPNNDKLDLRTLSIKLCGLLALISGHRVQTLASINVDNVKQFGSSFKIFVPGRLKNSGLNVSQPVIVIPEFVKNKKLCVKLALKEYLQRTESLRKDKNLFVSTISPHKKVTSQTISKWLVKLLDIANVDTSIFKAHSFRHSSTSKAFSKGIPINSIYCNAGWSDKSRVFAKFYNRPCYDVNEFANAVMK